MDKNYEKEYIEFEKNNWWFIGRRDLISKILKNNKNKKILEIGCGSGMNLKVIKNNIVLGLDNSEFLIKNKVIKNMILGDANHLPLKPNSFDYILCLDIIEHIKDDVKIMKTIYGLLKTQGQLIISVPALNSLYGPHDKINKHYRRYNKSLLYERLKKAGFKDIKISFWNSTLFIPAALFKILKKYSKPKNESDVVKIPHIINKLLFNILKIENMFIIKGINLPIGISLFAIAKKR